MAAEFHCASCRWGVGHDERECIVCKTDVGFPNVRYATRGVEKKALTLRFAEAEQSAAQNGSKTNFEALSKRVELSKAVMNRRLGPLYDWVRSESQVFYSYHQLVKHGRRKPNDDTYDQQRIAAESAISPYFYDQLNIATLSLDGRGLTYYGPYTVTLKEKTIAHRTTVFTENPFHFLERHKVVAGSNPPVGYRAAWADRAQVAMAKLGGAVTPAETEDEFSQRLMSADIGSDKSDFVELHIFGSIHASSIESVSGPVPIDAAEVPIWNTVERKLKELGAIVEVI